MNDFESASALPSLSTLGVTALLLTLGVLLQPRATRVYVSLGIAAFILTLSRLPNLAEIAGLAKMVSGYSLIIVAFTAVNHPGPKRKLPLATWVYPVLALASVPLVSGAEDRTLAMAIQFQWFTLTLAATLVCRCATSTRALSGVLKALGVGLGFGAAVALSSLVFDPGASFYRGMGRFTPYGCNPNQIAVVFALSVALGAYALVPRGDRGNRWHWALLAVVGSCGCLMCVSRMAFGVAALGAAPSLLRLGRRPATAMVFAGLLAFALFHVASSDHEFDMTHIENAHGVSRWEWTSEVLEEVEKRPLFGMFYGRGAYAQEEGLNAHNAYIEMAYLCGFVYAIPNVVLVLYSLFCGLRCATASDRSRYDPLLIQVACTLHVASVVNGLANNIIYYPTYSWAFLHVFLTQLLLTEHRSIASAGAPKLLRPAGSRIRPPQRSPRALAPSA